jgi:16S rRNA (guanine527-N7)-methyltransferase
MVVDMELLKKYFSITEEQESQLNTYAKLLQEWNEKINLISRKDTDSIIEKHILHCLSIYKTKEIKPGYSVLDVGTGGGLPGIPLAIMYPNSNFTLVDSILKKITATSDMVDKLGLNNVVCIHNRVENLDKNFDIITGRAVTRLIDFYKFTHKLLLKYGKYMLLKGGDLDEEIREFETYSLLKVITIPLSKYYEESFFETKQILEIKKR